jgi:hypothetical protein
MENCVRGLSHSLWRFYGASISGMNPALPIKFDGQYTRTLAPGSRVVASKERGPPLSFAVFEKHVVAPVRNGLVTLTVGAVNIRGCGRHAAISAVIDVRAGKIIPMVGFEEIHPFKAHMIE